MSTTEASQFERQESTCRFCGGPILLHENVDAPPTVSSAHEELLREARDEIAQLRAKLLAALA